MQKMNVEDDIERHQEIIAFLTFQLQGISPDIQNEALVLTDKIKHLVGSTDATVATVSKFGIALVATEDLLNQAIAYQATGGT